jgi:hypothetical protein
MPPAPQDGNQYHGRRKRQWAQAWGEEELPADPDVDGFLPHLGDAVAARKLTAAQVLALKARAVADEEAFAAFCEEQKQQQQQQQEKNDEGRLRGAASAAGAGVAVAQAALAALGDVDAERAESARLERALRELVGADAHAATAAASWSASASAVCDAAADTTDLARSVRDERAHLERLLQMARM